MSRFLLLGLLAALAAPARATEPLEGVMVAEFRGAASMGHKFSGAVTSLPFRVSFHRGPDNRELADFRVEAEMSALTTFHPKRDREMREHFRAVEHPKVAGTARDVDWAALTAPGETRALPFTLDFAGGRVPLSAAVTRVVSAPDGTVRFDAGFTVSQKACGCEPITMMALMRVRDDVPVTAHFTLRPAGKP